MMVNRVELAPNGPKVSELVQGYWRMAEWGMSPQERLTFLKQHIELGVTTVDQADVYGGYTCEGLLGEAIRLDPGVRDAIEIVTKCNIKLCADAFPERTLNHYDSSNEHIIASVNNSLSLMNIENIDVLLLHRADALMDADEVAEAFGELRAQGKVNHIGVSNFSNAQFELLQSRIDQTLVTNQVEINPLNFDVIHDGTLDCLQMKRTRPMAWSCLAGGEIFNSQSEQALRVRKELEMIRDEVGATGIDQVSFAWVNSLPSKPVLISGSGKIERVRAAAKSIEIKLTREQWYRVWVASKGHGVP